MSASDLHIVVGLGVTGLSCIRYLKQLGVPVAVTDTRANPPHLDTLRKDYPDVPVALGALDDAFLRQAGTIVISPGIPLFEPAIAAQIKRGINVIGDVELFALHNETPVIAITGTNAKSTVTTLVGKMAEAACYKVQVGGNLGVPVLELMQREPKANLFVLELSSFQLETTYSLKPNVATVLNITPDHMDRYGDLAAYKRAKHRIYQHCQVAVCNRDDALTDTISPAKFFFTLDKPNKNEFGLLEIGKETYLAYEDHPLLATKELPVNGKHYQANALASLALGFGFGLPFEAMIDVLREFKGLPHRCQLVRERNGVKWYNDSKGTNVGATQAAIEGLGSDMDGKLVVIAGGIGKNADFNPLTPLFEKYARHVVLIGEAANEIAHVIGNRVPTSFAKTLDEAVAQAASFAKQNDSVLLSPACASFDMFKNFEHRGDVFMEIVKALP